MDKDIIVKCVNGIISSRIKSRRYISYCEKCNVYFSGYFFFSGRGKSSANAHKPYIFQKCPGCGKSYEKMVAHKKGVYVQDEETISRFLLSKDHVVTEMKVAIDLIKMTQKVFESEQIEISSFKYVRTMLGSNIAVRLMNDMLAIRTINNHLKKYNFVTIKDEEIFLLEKEANYRMVNPEFTKRVVFNYRKDFIDITIDLE